MKRLFTLLLVVCAFTATKAQLPDGSIAPNWTMDDINGNSHTLYNYLDSGYVVFLDFSATWCGPCWTYHTSNAFKDLHNQYGPGTADDKVRVFMIEGDGSTTSADLHGTTSSTQGNWVAGVPYPIIDNDAQTSAYQIGYWPTIYRVCPSRMIIEAGQQNTAGLWSLAQEAECAAATQGTDVSIVSYDGQTNVCGGGAANATVTIQNFGTNPLTSVTVDIKDGSNVVATQTWNGSLATYGTQQVSVGSLAPASTTNYTIEVTASGDVNMGNNTLDQEVVVAPLTGSDNFTLEIKTDNYGYETAWQIVDAQNIAWASGGNATVLANGGGQGTASSANSGAYASGATITEAISLPADGCYKVVMYDDFGDGMCCSFGAGSYKFMDDVGNVLINSTGEFAVSEDNPFEAKTFGSSVENVAGLSNLNLFPNPATTTLNVQFALANAEELNISVMNALGQVVKVVNAGELAAGAQNLTIDTNELAAGMYFLSFTNGAQTTTERFVVAK